MMTYHAELKVKKSIIIVNLKLTFPPLKRAVNKSINIEN